MKRAIFKNVSLILCAALYLVFVFVMTQTKFVYAAEVDNEIVLEELTSDPNFNPEDYPDDPEDFSLQVIQIGEDVDKNLYLYIYQPSHNSIDLLGMSVSISYGFSNNGANLSPQMYELELVSTSGVFDKYLVKDFAESTGSNTQGQRYYNIVAIYREFNSVIDSSIDYGETDEIGYSVGQQWYAYDVNNSVSYQMNTFKTLEVTINLLEYLEFNNGFCWENLIMSQIDQGYVWFAAFNLEDYAALHIYDADISFRVRTVEIFTQFLAPTETTYGEWEDKVITLTDADVMSHQGDGLWAREYSWNRIQSASDFLSTAEANKVEVTEATRTKVEQSQWVFSFYETEYLRQVSTASNSIFERYSEVEEFAILRIKFMDTNHKTFDLGVVSDKVSADDISGGYGGLKDIEEIMSDIGALFEKVAMIIGIILLVVIVIALLGFVTPVSNILKFIFKAIVFVITLPFRIIKGLFKKGG